MVWKGVHSYSEADEKALFPLQTERCRGESPYAAYERHCLTARSHVGPVVPEKFGG